MEKELQTYHDNKNALPMRWVLERTGYYGNHNGGCFHGFGDILQDTCFSSVGLVFHGDGAQISWDGLTNPVVFNKELQQHDQPFSVMKGTDRTKEWVKFLLSNQSPWKKLLPYLRNNNVEYINNAGFIFDPPHTLPSKLIYNFAMGMRFPWEMPKAFALWLLLRPVVKDDGLAFYIASHFELADNAGSIQGPYNIVYPWSCLEETGYETIGRFLAGEPAAMKAKTAPSNPNVHALWSISHPKVLSEAKHVLNKFTETDPLFLDTIRRSLDRLRDQQERWF